MKKRTAFLPSLLFFCLIHAALPAAAAEGAPSAELLADWETRQVQGQALQRDGSARQAEAKKNYEQTQLECQKSFLVNSCLSDARKVYNLKHNEALRLENEGKAIERQIRKEQLSDRDLRRAAAAPQREASLEAREAVTSGERQDAAAAQAAKEASKARKSAEGSQRKAADAERLAKKRTAHEQKVNAQMEKAARRKAEADAKAAKK